MEQPPPISGAAVQWQKKRVGFAGTVLVENVSYESSAVDMGLRFWAEGVHGVAIGQLESDDGIGWQIWQITQIRIIIKIITAIIGRYAQVNLTNPPFSDPLPAVTPRLRLVLDGCNFCKAHKARDRDSLESCSRSTQNLRFSKFYMNISQIQDLR